MGLLNYHASTWEQLIRALIAMAVEGAEATQELKANQYTDGLAVYRKRQVGNIPATFHLNVADLPGGAQFV